MMSWSQLIDAIQSYLEGERLLTKALWIAQGSERNLESAVLL